MSGALAPSSLETARALMLRFAERTGIEGECASRRYLWTDAHAVCNALALHDATGDGRFRRMARALIERVHEQLARHRPDDARRGWLSGLSDAEARAHPTRAGLRIGKPLPERSAGEPLDERLEWDRDGQYFHYLTRWMHALAQASVALREPRYARWARELYAAAHAGFVRRCEDGTLRMAWKMSIDLRRPLVASMGQHDPLDGLVIGLALRASAEGDEPALASGLADFATLAEMQSRVTSDPLGLGGLLFDTSLVAQLRLRGACEDEALFLELLDASCRSLAAFLTDNPLREPAARRLAFRELGLAIGLAALEPVLALGVERTLPRAQAAAAARKLDVLRRARGLRELICGYWQEPAHRDVVPWRSHLDINEVMLATALLPQGWVVLRRAEGSGQEEGAWTTTSSGTRRAPAPPAAR